VKRSGLYLVSYLIDRIDVLLVETLERIQGALEDGGIEFLQASQRSNGGGPGIRRRP
jgi:hypothetical protein